MNKLQLSILLLCGEYIFGEHFSIGSEIGFPFAIANKDAAIGFGFNRLILRFYP